MSSETCEELADKVRGGKKGGEHAKKRKGCGEKGGRRRP